MEITVNCEAMRELAQAINTLAAAFEAGNFKLTTAAVQQTVQPTAPVAPVATPVNHTPAAPVQQEVLTTAPVAQVQAAPVNAVPTAAPSYTMEQLAVAATQLMDAGRRNEIVALVGQFGVQALNMLPKEQYGNFANALRGMGAKL